MDPLSRMLAILAILSFLSIVLFGLLRVSPRPKRAGPVPLKCPHCQSGKIDVLTTALWDGADFNGRGMCGVLTFGICKDCGSRCARFDDDEPTFVPTDEQWQAILRPRKP